MYIIFLIFKGSIGKLNYNYGACTKMGWSQFQKEREWNDYVYNDLRKTREFGLCCDMQ